MTRNEAERLKLGINGLRAKAEAICEDLATGVVVPPSKYAGLDNYSRNLCKLVDDFTDSEGKE